MPFKGNDEVGLYLVENGLSERRQLLSPCPDGDDSSLDSISDREDPEESLNFCRPRHLHPGILLLHQTLLCYPTLHVFNAGLPCATPHLKSLQ